MLTRWIETTWMDPEKRARLLHRLWLISLGMVGIGYAVIAQHYWRQLHWP